MTMNNICMYSSFGDSVIRTRCEIAKRIVELTREFVHLKLGHAFCDNEQHMHVG